MQAPRQKDESVTFRLDPELKADLSAIADKDHLPMGEVLRTLVRDLVARRRREAFEQEAHRQSEAIAARAATPGSEEARIMDELAARLDELDDEWT